MKVLSREFIPDGPVILDETIHIATDSLYTPLSTYDLLIYNLAKDEFSAKQVRSSTEGRLEFSLPGGGNIVGIHGEDRGPDPDLRVVDILNRDYIYVEQGRENSLHLRLVNIGNSDALHIAIRAFSSYPYIQLYRGRDQYPRPGIRQVRPDGSGFQIQLQPA